MQSPIKYMFIVYQHATPDQQQAIIQAVDDMMRGSMWSPKTFHLVQNAFIENGFLDTLDFQEVQDLAKELCQQGWNMILRFLTAPVRGSAFIKYPLIGYQGETGASPIEWSYEQEVVIINLSNNAIHYQVAFPSAECKILFGVVLPHHWLSWNDRARRKVIQEKHRVSVIVNNMKKEQTMTTTKEHIDRFFGLPMKATKNGEQLDKFDDLVAEAITEAESKTGDPKEVATLLQQAACVMYDTLHEQNQVDEDGNLL